MREGIDAAHLRRLGIVMEPDLADPHEAAAGIIYQDVEWSDLWATARGCSSLSGTIHAGCCIAARTVCWSRSREAPPSVAPLYALLGSFSAPFRWGAG